MIVGYLPQERRISMSVQKIESPKPTQALIPVRKIHDEINRTLLPFSYRKERRVPAETNANSRIGIPINNESSRHENVGPIEIRQLILPITLRKLEKERTDHRRIVEINSWIFFNII